MMETQKITKINEMKKNLKENCNILDLLEEEWREASHKLEDLRTKVYSFNCILENKDYETYKEYYIKTKLLREKCNEQELLMKKMGGECGEMIGDVINKIEFDCSREFEKI